MGCELAITAHLRLVDVQGELGIAGQTRGAYTCVRTFASDGGDMDWIETRALHFHSRGNGGSISGRWVAIGNDARLAIGRDLAVTGDAIWHGYGDNTHVGQVEGRGSMRQGILDVDADACVVRARRVERYLIVLDNHHCGGVNVSFAGVYRRR